MDDDDDDGGGGYEDAGDDGVGDDGVGNDGGAIEDDAPPGDDSGSPDDSGFDPNDIEIDDPQAAAGDGGGYDGNGGDGGDGGDGGGGDDGGGDDDGGGGDGDGDNGDDELASAPVDLPELDEDVYSSRESFANADDEDFEDDAGDWTANDYQESAQNLFGEHEYFGDTAHQRYLDEGFTAIGTMHPIVQDVRRRIPEASTIDFYEKDGALVPRGFLGAAALAALEAAFPQLVLDLVHVTVDRHPLDGEADRTPRELPDELRAINPADGVDLRKYATPIGDQGSTSRCAAFAWTHALEMLGNIRNQPFPPLACSYTMLTFQERQGDARDFAWAWKGGDGTAGTWEPGRHLFSNGTCRHELWPNDDREPSASIEAMRDDARAHTFDAEVYNVTIDDVKKLLSAGLPVQISMATGEAFQDIARDGVMKVAEAPSGQHGYHAMLCVGYVGNYFIVKNSWGTDWGDNGYCYIPKVVLAESEPELVAIVPKKLGGAGG